MWAAIETAPVFRRFESWVTKIPFSIRVGKKFASMKTRTSKRIASMTSTMKMMNTIASAKTTTTTLKTTSLTTTTTTTTTSTRKPRENRGLGKPSFPQLSTPNVYNANPPETSRRKIIFHSNRYKSSAQNPEDQIMSYENAPATIMLATHCCCCGRPLVDAISVEMGIGPDCRQGRTDGISKEQQEICNKLTHAAALAAQEGQVEKVRAIAAEIAALGLTELADKVQHRFVNAERLAKINIIQTGDRLTVTTPWKRSSDFVAAWRTIPGRRYGGAGKNIIPLSSKGELWNLLQKFFPGQFGKGPKGLFRVPKNEAA